MTSLKDPIQSLIAEIDGILHKAGSRRPWPMSSDGVQQRRVLERVRDYLVSQQPKENTSFPSPHEQSGQEAAQQIAQAVAKEMASLKANLMQPLQVELEALRREREFLSREIRQMENRASHYNSLAQQQAKQQQIISDFLQTLMSRLQESLTQVVAKTMANLETQFLCSEFTKDQSQQMISAPANSKLESSAQVEHLASGQFPLHPRERLEQLRQMQAQSDQILTNLDSTLRVVLEALQRNVMGYQESLSQGVAKMHDLGQQSEVLFTALTNRMTQQLEPEVSDHLPPNQIQPVSDRDESAKNSAESNRLKRSVNSTQQQFPFAGMEMPSQQQTDLKKQGGRGAQGQIPQRDSPPNMENWEVIKLDLDNLGLEQTDTDEIDTILQLDIEDLGSKSPSAPTVSPLPEDDRGVALSDEKTGEHLESEVRTQGTQQSVGSESSNQEVDDLYALLFGAAALTDTVEPDEFKSLTQESAIAAERQQSKGERNSATSSPPDSWLTIADSENQPEAQIEDPLFAEPEEITTFTESSSLAPLSLFPDSWEDVLFYEDATLPVNTTKADFAPHSLPENSEGGETISVMTDLFDEKELRNSEQESTFSDSPASVEEKQTEKQTLEETALTPSPLALPLILSESANPVRSQPGQPSDSSLQTEVVEDSYIHALPEENLLVTAQSESELDIKLLLEQETLRRLSEELSRFESFEEQDVQVPKEPLERANDAASTPLPDQIDQSSPSLDAESINPMAFGGSPGLTASEPLAVTTYELLAEDWENFALDYPDDENAFPKAAANEAIAEVSITQSNQSNLGTSMDLGAVDTAQTAENIEDNQQIEPIQSHSHPESVDSQAPTSAQVDWNSNIFGWENLNWDLEGEITEEEVFGKWKSEEASTNFELPILNLRLSATDQEVENIQSDEQTNLPQSQNSQTENVSHNQALTQPEAMLLGGELGENIISPQTSEEQEEIGESIDFLSTPSSEIPNIISEFHQIDWNPDVFEWEDLNWDLEEDLGAGEEAFNKWIIDEADTDFVRSMDFGLEAPSQESKTDKSDQPDRQIE